jgi:C1A family cysteine protease
MFHPLGCKKDPKDNRDFRLAGIVNAEEVKLPPVFNLQEVFESNNQFSRGSCTSQAQSHHKERQEYSQMSARFIMALSKMEEGNVSYGAYNRTTFKVVNKYGVCEQDLFPEPDDNMSWREYVDYTLIPQNCFEDAKKHKSESYWRIDNNINLLKTHLYTTNTSAALSMEWYREFNDPVDGMITTFPSVKVGGHCTDVCGWDDNKGVFKIKNSWSKLWGLNGFFYLPYSIFNTVVWDIWTSKDLPASFPVDERYGVQRTWKTYMEEKKVAFNVWLTKKIGRLPNNREISALVYGNHDFSTVFNGVNNEVWLYKTKPQLIKEGFNYKI